MSVNLGHTFLSQQVLIKHQRTAKILNILGAKLWNGPAATLNELRKLQLFKRHPEDDLFLDPGGIKKVKGPFKTS